MSQQINLFNPAFQKKKKFFTAVPIAEALGVIVTGALLLTWYAHYQVGQLEQRAQAGKMLVAERERRLADANRQFAPREKSAPLAQQLAQVHVELAAMQRLEAFLATGALGNSDGYAEYFRALARQNLPGLWLTGVSIAGAGTHIGVQGRAMQPTLIPQYIFRLTSEPVMRGKTFASLDIARPQTPAVTTVTAPSTSTVPVTVATAAMAAPYVQFSLQSVPPEGAP